MPMGKLNLSSLNVKAFIGSYPFAWLVSKNTQSQYAASLPFSENPCTKVTGKTEKDPPYYNQFISKHNDWPDYTDYSGGCLGIL